MDQRLGHLVDISTHHTEYYPAWASLGGDINIVCNLLIPGEVFLEETQLAHNNLTHFATLNSVSKNRNHHMKYNCETKN